MIVILCGEPAIYFHFPCFSSINQMKRKSNIILIKGGDKRVVMPLPRHCKPQRSNPEPLILLDCFGDKSPRNDENKNLNNAFCPLPILKGYPKPRSYGHHLDILPELRRAYDPGIIAQNRHSDLRQHAVSGVGKLMQIPYHGF